MDRFVSNFTLRLDAKGRVSIPASYRAVLARDGHDGLYCYPALDQPAVDAGGNALLAEIEALITSYPPYSDERDAFTLSLYGTSETLKVDGEGRVIFSDALKTHAGITEAIAFVGLVFAFSQTSFLALFAGLVVLVAFRWSFRWTAIAAAVAVLAIGVGLTVRSSSNDSNSINTEGHGTLVSGGLKLAKHRPLYGYGSASFSKEFAREENVPPGDTTISHSEPVTVAAEQGLIGVAAYLALLAAALWTLFGGMRSIAPGLGANRPADGVAAEVVVARIAVAAGFCALLVHTIGYAGYLTDPLTWALLAAGGVLAAEAGVGDLPARGEASSGQSEE